MSESESSQVAMQLAVSDTYSHASKVDDSHGRRDTTDFDREG